MTDAVIVAVITAVSSVIVQLVIASQSREETNAKLDTALAVQKTKLEELTTQVAKHNSIIERTYKLESDVAVINERLHGLEEKQ